MMYKILWGLLVVLTLSLIALIDVQRFTATGLHFFVVGENQSSVPDECKEIKIAASFKTSKPVIFYDKTLLINPKLIYKLKMPEKYAGWYDVSAPPTLYNYNGSRPAIIFIGDSYTAGAAVQYNETFPFYLSQELDYNIINLGIGGYNTKQEVERLKKVGLKYKPKVVVIQFYHNDWENGYEIWSYMRNISVLLNHNGYDCLKDPLSNKDPVFMGLSKIYYRYNLKRRFDLFNPNVATPLDELHNLSLEYNFSVIFLLLPSPKWEEEKLINSCKQYGWDLVYLREETDFHGWKPPYTVSIENPHFSPRTHKEVAKLLSKRIKKLLR